MSSRFKSLYILALLTMPIFSMEFEVPKANLFSTSGKLKVIRDSNGFSVLRGGERKRVESYDTSSLLRKMTPKKLSSFTKNKNNYIKIYKMMDSKNDLSYRLGHGTRLNGGGPLGATIGVISGRAVVYGFFATAAAIVTAPIALTAAGTAGAGIAAGTLLMTFAPVIESTALVGGLVGGMTGAIVTGPA